MTSKLNRQKDANRKMRRVMRDQRKALVALKTSVENSCSQCDYDEAEGFLVNHCAKCCHRITALAWEITHPKPHVKEPSEGKR